MWRGAESVRLIGSWCWHRWPRSASSSALQRATCAVEAATAGLGWAESSRGEALAWLSFDGAGGSRGPRCALPRSATGAGLTMPPSQNVFTDIPIIEASFWLTVAGTAR